MQALNRVIQLFIISVVICLEVKYLWILWSKILMWVYLICSDINNATVGNTCSL